MVGEQRPLRLARGIECCLLLKPALQQLRHGRVRAPHATGAAQWQVVATPGQPVGVGDDLQLLGRVEQAALPRQVQDARAHAPGQVDLVLDAIRRVELVARGLRPQQRCAAVPHVIIEHGGGVLEHGLELRARELHHPERVVVRVEPEQVAPRDRSGGDRLTRVEHRRQRDIGARGIDLAALDHLQQWVVGEAAVGGGEHFCRLAHDLVEHGARGLGVGSPERAQCGVARDRVGDDRDARLGAGERPLLERRGAGEAQVDLAERLAVPAGLRHERPADRDRRDHDMRVPQHQHIDALHLVGQSKAEVLARNLADARPRVAPLGGGIALEPGVEQHDHGLAAFGAAQARHLALCDRDRIDELQPAIERGIHQHRHRGGGEPEDTHAHAVDVAHDARLEGRLSGARVEHVGGEERESRVGTRRVEHGAAAIELVVADRQRVVAERVERRDDRLGVRARPFVPGAHERATEQRVASVHEQGGRAIGAGRGDQRRQLLESARCGSIAHVVPGRERTMKVGGVEDAHGDLIGPCGHSAGGDEKCKGGGEAEHERAHETSSPGGGGEAYGERCRGRDVGR